MTIDETPPPLLVDPDRVSTRAHTGVYVRALGVSGRYRSADIAHIDAASLLRWLRERGGDNRRAEDVVGVLLGHGSLHDS